MEPAKQIVDLAFHRDVLFAAIGVFAALRSIHGWPLLSRTSIYRRMLPVLPEILGIILAWTGGIPIVALLPDSSRIAAGFWVGFMSQRAHKILGQTILGDDPALSKPPKVKNGGT